jgi:hypothetical protein
MFIFSATLFVEPTLCPAFYVAKLVALLTELASVILTASTHKCTA